MEVSPVLKFELRALDDVGHARRRASEVARRAGLDEEEQGQVAICVTEASTNAIKHGHGGELLLTLENHGAAGLSILALDRGPGMSNVAQSMRDGHSSTGSSGTGLGALSRQSHTFDIFSAPGKGAALFMRFWPGGRPPKKPGVLVGGVSVPVRGEEVCGDGWSAAEREDRMSILVSDGLGHGPQAREASVAAIETFERSSALAPSQIVDRIHGGLKSTRGAAAAVAEISKKTGTVRFCGVGNIAGAVFAGGRWRHMVSHHGTLGHDVRKVREFQYPWSDDGVLVLTSDGIHSQWSLESYPGIMLRHPVLIAGLVYRDFQRERDDATVVVARGVA